MPCRRPRPIVDRSGLIIGCIVAPPDSPSYGRDAEELLDIFVEESESDAFSSGELRHKRGDFPAVNFGWTLPSGFQHPINLSDSRHRAKIDRICKSSGFRQISGVQNGAFAFWNPGVYDYQKKRVEQVLAEKSDRPPLRRTTPKTAFPTTACNFRRVCCCPHRDTQNCPFGWCAITALGKFDHRRGGHLILWELKLVIEFPHGYTILIPSATVTHLNTPVADAEIRMSMTQYCAGSVLRYADNLGSTDKNLWHKNKALYGQNQADRDERWRMSLGLLSTVDDLEKGRRGRSIAAMFQ
ncbi:hypothetical protein HYPSUDRAFT_141348 [Hypholoma sublateritium FD-334 SS-4]|uniref:Prolyl 4-hydroxylase alpha subunit Fe(2+) 2OG dioxygenase domain-containing protein n=1 Tax=Hypholoma sublateritium (strain FD-334 SS-4) TaxID=945553 RepID=A0A0D2NXA7_HYPSF|nr:hypothetical protein HYPSUDRAFT_141348 [Hypholoma sublateritium FD-334 SS-4]